MNPRIKLLFVVGTALTIGRALDLGLWTDLESGLCAVGPVWLRYAALAVGVLAAICIGRKLAMGRRNCGTTANRPASSRRWQGHSLLPQDFCASPLE